MDIRTKDCFESSRKGIPILTRRLSKICPVDERSSGVRGFQEYVSSGLIKRN